MTTMGSLACCASQETGMARRRRRKQSGGSLQVQATAYGDMRAVQKKERKKKDQQRDFAGQIVGPDNRVRVNLAHPGRKILAPPPGPVNANYNTGVFQRSPAPVDIYAMPTCALPHYKRTAYRNRTANATAPRRKYRTKYSGRYVTKENTSQYRRRDTVAPLDPVQRIH